MNGSICKRGKESWRIQIYIGKDESGKRVRFFETVVGTKEDATERLRELSAMTTKISHREELSRLSEAHGYETRRLLERVEELKLELDEKQPPVSIDRFMKLRPNEELRSHSAYRAI